MHDAVVRDRAVVHDCAVVRDRAVVQGQTEPAEGRRRDAQRTAVQGPSEGPAVPVLRSQLRRRTRGRRDQEGGKDTR